MRALALTCILLASASCALNQATSADTSPFNAVALDGAALDVPPALIPGTCGRPTYPRELREAGVSGQVYVRFIIDATGAVDPGSLRPAGGDLRFEESAIASIRACRFVPAQKGGSTVAARVTAPVNYEISR